MKISMLLSVPLAATLMLPAMAQQSTSESSSQPAATSQSTSQAATTTTQDSNSAPSAASDDMSARQPLQPETHEGFWGKVNPFARKKYVQRQLSPIRNRVNELDDLTAANTKQIKDVDARAQEGIRQADAKATQADQHAIDAGNKAQQANQTALQASNHLNTVEQVVGNIDQYQPATQTEIRFRSGQTALSPKAKQALDDMTANLKDQKGYIIEVQGFSTGGGQSGVQSSQAMANSVVRYLVTKNDVPVYRVFVMGMGNAKLPASEDGSKASTHGNRVEISLLKNNVDQLAAAQSSGEMGSSMAQQNNSYSTSTQNQSAPNSQTNTMNSAPSNSYSSQPQR